MITDWWLGLHEQHQTAVRICCRCDSNDPVTLALNGQTVVATPDTAVDDGNITLEVTGLAAGQRYPFTLTQTNTETGTAKTSPADGATYEFVVGSCFGVKKDWYHGLKLAERDFAFFIAEGDQVYIDQPAGGTTTTNPGTLEWNGETLQSMTWYSDDLGREPTDAEFMETYYQKYRAYFRAAGYKALIRSTPHLQTTDDHTWPGNDPACNAGAQLVGGLNYLRDATNAAGAFCLSQDHVNKHWQFGIDAYRAYAKGNPASSNVGSRAAAVFPRLNAEKLYYDFIIGNCHFIVLECVAFRDTPTAGLVDPYTAERNGKSEADATKTMLDMSANLPSEPQWEWLKSTLINSTCDLKCIISSKETIGVQDAWQLYDVNQARLLAFLDAAVNGGNPDGWVKPGGCFVIAGDVHRGAVLYDEANQHLQMRCAPASQYVNTSINSMANHRWFDSKGTEHLVVITKITLDYAEPRVESQSGQILWHGRIYPGSNALVVGYSSDAVIGRAVSGLDV